MEPVTFGQQFQTTVEHYGNVPALKSTVEVGEGQEKTMEWKMATFKEYYAMSIAVLWVCRVYGYCTISVV